MSLDSAPKYGLLPGFSCTISSVLLLAIAFFVDAAIACAARRESQPVVVTATLRTSPSHVSHYHVTSSPLGNVAAKQYILGNGTANDLQNMTTGTSYT